MWISGSASSSTMVLSTSVSSPPSFNSAFLPSERSSSRTSRGRRWNTTFTGCARTAMTLSCNSRVWRLSENRASTNTAASRLGSIVARSVSMDCVMTISPTRFISLSMRSRSTRMVPPPARRAKAPRVAAHRRRMNGVGGRRGRLALRLRRRLRRLAFRDGGLVGRRSARPSSGALTDVLMVRKERLQCLRHCRRWSASVLTVTVQERWQLKGSRSAMRERARVARYLDGAEDLERIEHHARIERPAEHVRVGADAHREGPSGRWQRALRARAASGSGDGPKSMSNSEGRAGRRRAAEGLERRDQGWLDIELAAVPRRGNQRAEDVAGLKKRGDRGRLDRDTAGAQGIEARFEAMGKGDKIAEPERACAALDRMHRAEGAVDILGAARPSAIAAR